MTKYKNYLNDDEIEKVNGGVASTNAILDASDLAAQSGLEANSILTASAINANSLEANAINANSLEANSAASNIAADALASNKLTGAFNSKALAIKKGEVKARAGKANTKSPL